MCVDNLTCFNNDNNADCEINQGNESCSYEADPLEYSMPFLLAPIYV